MASLRNALSMLIVGTLVFALGACSGGSENSTERSPGQSSSSAAPTSTPATVRAAADCALTFSSLAKPQAIGTDPLLAQQWHLINTGQSNGTIGEDTRATLAWPSSRGAGVWIAVTDVGIDLTHPDLMPNLVADESYNYLDADGRGVHWPLPCTAQDTHGTAVAGIALARDGNAMGGAGLAPRASLVAYNALSMNDDASLADAMTRGKNNQIWLNSWGSPDTGSPQAAPRIWQQAIDEGLRNARAGRGAIYVFPGGNGGQIDVYSASGRVAARIADDSNLDGYANKRGVIAVCSVDDRGMAPSYAERGANLLVCAPGEGHSADITTTTLTDAYTSSFAGTSASAPMVSGVAALMLAVNPSLTWRDVQRILSKTARLNQPNDSGWIAGAGIRYNHQYGFGVVDADAAVRTAKSWVSVGGSAQQRVCGPYSAAPATPIPDAGSFSTPGAPVLSSLATPGCGISEVEFVEVNFSADHPYAGDLRIRLFSPNQLVSQLATERACGTDVPEANNPCKVSYQDWRFGSVRHLGEPLNRASAAGPWTLEVSDHGPGDTGVLSRWSLTLYGS